MRLFRSVDHLFRALDVRRFFSPLIARRTRRFLTSSEMAQKGIGVVDAEWRERIDTVLASSDNEHIPRVPDAGTVNGFHVVMHNGVKVCANGYYGAGVLNMLVENRGVHEPQEERVFEEVVARLPEQCTMLELGAYWGFYSLSLLRQRPEAQCYLVEPRPFNLTSGRLNFELNGCQGHFVQARVGAEPRRFPRTIAVDPFCREHGIEHLHVLHADIQSFELQMLHGAREMLSAHRVDYVFISTHSGDLHRDCRAELESLGYRVIASADMDETYSLDGLIVACRPGLEGVQPIDISKRAA